jgi:hypothetical protein
MRINILVENIRLKIRHDGVSLCPDWPADRQKHSTGVLDEFRQQFSDSAESSIMPGIQSIPV